MPPRKSNVSAVSTEEGATGTPAKESGVGVEVYTTLPLLSCYTCLIGGFLGIQPPTYYDPTIIQRRLAPKHTDTKGCTISHIQKRYSVRQLPHCAVRKQYAWKKAVIPLEQSRSDSLTSANESAQRANKKTIQPKDVMDAIAEIEFDHFLPRLDGELTSTPLPSPRNIPNNG